MAQPPFYRRPGSPPIHPIDVNANSVLARDKATTRQITQQVPASTSPRQALTYTAKAPIILTGTVFSLPLASSTGDGYLSASDWSVFNSKEPALGNPGVSGYVLSSTTGGVRSWVPNGAGGSGFPTVALTKPVAADYVTWINQSGASVADGTTGLVFTSPGPTTDPSQAQVFSTTAFTGNTWEVRFNPTFVLTNNVVAGPVLRENGTTKSLSWGFLYYQPSPPSYTYLLSYFTGTTRMGFTLEAPGIAPSPWMRMRISAGTVYFEVSASGETGDWQTITSGAVATYFTTAPDQMGFSMSNTAAGSFVIQSALQY